MSTSHFEECWERVRILTGWTKFAQLAEFLDVRTPTISCHKNRGKMRFPYSWSLRIAKQYHCSVDWILCGIEPDKAEEPLTIQKAEEMNENPSDLTISDKTNLGLLLYILSGIQNFQNKPFMSQNEAAESVRTIYRFCQAENSDVIRMICLLTLGWIENHTDQNDEGLQSVLESNT